MSNSYQKLKKEIERLLGKVDKQKRKRARLKAEIKEVKEMFGRFQMSESRAWDRAEIWEKQYKDLEAARKRYFEDGKRGYNCPDEPPHYNFGWSDGTE